MSYDVNNPSKYLSDNEHVIYRNPFNGRNTIIELWSNPIGQFTVRSGATSDYSYTGFIPDVNDMQAMRTAVKQRYDIGKIFY
jgi:hypothetical protein